MNNSCFICNARTGASLRNALNLFGDDVSLSSGKKLSEVIGDIVDKLIKEDVVHTRVICKKCQKAIVEYDSLQVRLQAIKTELLENFKKTLPKHNLSYDTYNKEVKIVNSSNIKKNEVKTLVLPASKLQPLPPDFVIKSGKWPISKSNIVIPKLKSVVTIPASSTLNLKVTVGSSVLTQSIITNTIANKKSALANQTIDPKLIMTPKVEKNDQPSISTNVMNFVSSSMKSDEILTSSTVTFTQPISSNTLVSTKSSPILSFNVNSLPKDFLSSAILTKVDDFDIEKLKKEGSIEVSELEQADEQPMEIDEDCSLTVLSTNESDNKLIFDETVKDDEDKSKSEYLDVRLLGEQGRYVLGKLQVLRPDADADADADAEADVDTDEHTIVMEGENGSILRVVSGQKILYGDNQISLMLPGLQDSVDGQDSNDESQIELQVSGDEETANAIIAAAQEQGGAFIKVESGEMYRVQSVQSTTEDDETSNVDTSMVVHEDGQFRCLLCEKNETKERRVVVGDAEAAMQHVKSAHGARLYICRVCGRALRRRAHYAAHVEQHAQKNKALQNTDKTKLHECNICKKKYSSRTLLTEHMNVHSGSRPYACDVCGKAFASKYTHQSHLKTHLVRPRPYKCEQCGKSFFTLQNLNQHEKTHSGVKDFICNVCGKAFGTQHNLEVHGVVHSGSKPFVCGACGKAFARRAEVRDHMRIHTGERPFTCDVCGASFTQRSNLHSHKRATHLDDKRYHCTQCPKRFKRRRLLDYHVKASHTGERPLKCEICHATFVYPEHYKKHARIHSGEKPYTCEVCGKSFNSRDNRNTHRFVHSDRKPYECVVCGAGYMRKQLLYQHMNTSGHLAESIVVNQPRVTKINENMLTTQAVVVDTEKSDKFPDTIYETTEELQLEADDKSIVTTDESGTKFYITGDKKILLQEGKTINIVQESEEPTLLTLHNIDSSLKADGTLIDTIPADQLTDQQQAGALRLVSVSLPDGSSGWVAINN
nr:zinc finger and BTB domain-containing protein 41-like [Vanessa tameamea]